VLSDKSRHSSHIKQDRVHGQLFFFVHFKNISTIGLKKARTNEDTMQPMKNTTVFSGSVVGSCLTDTIAANPIIKKMTL
jgi:hypothetical protein